MTQLQVEEQLPDSPKDTIGQEADSLPLATETKLEASSDVESTERLGFILLWYGQVHMHYGLTGGRVHNFKPSNLPCFLQCAMMDQALG